MTFGLNNNGFTGINQSYILSALSFQSALNATSSSRDSVDACVDVILVRHVVYRMAAGDFRGSESQFYSCLRSSSLISFFKRSALSKYCNVHVVLVHVAIF